MGSAPTGILFSTGTNADSSTRGKGALVYEAMAGWNVGDFHFLQNSVADASIATLSDAVMTIKNNGNVGIGTTSPATKLDVNGAGSFAGALDMNSHQINEVTDPTSAQDAATKNYVDKINAIGSANAQWRSFSGWNSDGGFKSSGGGRIENVSTGSPYFVTYWDLPTTMGDLKLYIKGVRIALKIAGDGSNYITDIFLRGSTTGGTYTNVDSHTKNISAIGYTAYSLASDTDMSSYRKFGCDITAVSNGASKIQVMDVQMNYYYAP